MTINTNKAQTSMLNKTKQQVGHIKCPQNLFFNLLERANSEFLKLLHLIFLTISSIVAEFHSPVRSISEK